MKTLYLRIYLTVVVVLAVFALASGWFVQRHIEQEHSRAEAMLGERMAAWGELLRRALPPAQAPAVEQAQALQEWSQRLRLPLALSDAQGHRIAASTLYVEREQDGTVAGRAHMVRFDDERTLTIVRRVPPPHADGDASAPRPGLAAWVGPPMPPHHDGPTADTPLPWLLPGWAQGPRLVVVLLLLFGAIAGGAWPVVRRLTRRLESLKQGVERFGAGALDHRVDASGRDEVAAVAASFNRTADRVQALLRAHQSLLANASHELRSPLARLKMAVSMMDGAQGVARVPLRREIEANIAELDALVEEVLLASRLDAQTSELPRDEVDLLVLAVEEAARVGAEVDGDMGRTDLRVHGDERLLRRALRNLLENAFRYGGGEIRVELDAQGGQLELGVCDRGPGVPAEMRERIFEPFFRLPGHAEQTGGVGLGLSLVRQIAQRHGGDVRWQAREGGGSRFVLRLPQDR